jgi:single-strand DNA-binding protein
MSIQGTIIGRLGKDPETRTIGSGKQVTNFNVACDHGFGEKKTTTWVRVAWWGERAAKVAATLKKGSGVIFTGCEVYTRDHEGKTYVEAEAQGFEYPPGAPKGNGGEASGGSGGSGSTGGGGFSDDEGVPF